MPGTAHAFAGDKSLGQRAVIMGAMRANGEDFVAAVHQQHLLVADMAEELAVDEIRQRDAPREVRTLWRILLLRHCDTPAFTRSYRETAGEARRRHDDGSLSPLRCGWRQEVPGVLQGVQGFQRP